MKKLVRRTIKVKNTLDTRQIAYLVQCAGQFKSDIRIEEDEKFINAKSIMGTISLKMIQFQSLPPEKMKIKLLKKSAKFYAD